MNQLRFALALSVLFAYAAFSSPRPATLPKPQPTEVKIVSVPAAVPTEVKVISTPESTPAEIKIVAMPKDEASMGMLRWTEGLVIANVLLCFVTVWASLKQGNDLKLRDRATMEREINRGAQRNMMDATRLDQLAQELPIKAARQNIVKRIREITDQSIEVVTKDAYNLKAKSDNEIVSLLRTVDSHEVQLRAMEVAIRAEMEKISDLRRQNSAMLEAVARQ